ncbi:MAG: tetratricopeptide repeat protein [Bryobacteraceae bacterium]
MDCDKIEGAEIAEKYVGGGLSEVEAADFELHFVSCQRCFERVQLLQDMQAVLERWPGRSVRWAGILAAAACLLLAAGLTWLHLRSAAGPEAARATPAAHPTLNLTALAMVSPPRYLQPRWRAAGPTSFDVAMLRYSSGDFAGATPGLLVAAKGDPGNSAAAFFLGICYLMQNRDDEAIAQLKATIALGDSPELEEAHFYLAKALLRKQNVPGAIAELRQAVAVHGPRQLEERNLLENIVREARPAK